MKSREMFFWVFAIVAISSLLWITWTSVVLLNEAKQEKSKTVIVHRVPRPWTDYGFHTWRRGGRPFGPRRRHRHRWRKSGGGKVGRPL